jgi:hypothetical protein
MGLFGHAAQPMLRDRDYLPVALPTTDVRVLQVLTRQGPVLRRYSDLAKVLVAADGSAAPAVTTDQAVADAAGNSRRSAKAGIGLGIVAALVRALGADADVDLTASAARTVEYGYGDVTADRVDLADLDTWLAEADFRPGLRNIADLLAAEQVYVITAALRARSVTVKLHGAKSGEVSAALPAIHGVVTPKVSVTVDGERGDTLTFTGQAPLTVAAKAAQLKFDEQGFWVNQRPFAGGEIRDFSGVSYLREPGLVLSAELGRGS